MGKIINVKRHYIYVPYKSPVAPYWGWQAATYGAHGVIIEVLTDDGLIGWGETAGREAIEKHVEACQFVIGKEAGNITQLVRELKQKGFRNAPISGIEMALWDLLGKRSDLPLYQLLGGKVRDHVKLCGLMGIKPPEEAVETIHLYKESYGFETVKTKAGRSAEEDFRIASAINKVFGTSIKLRLDANQNYDTNDCISLCQRLEDLNCIEYFEQPIHDDNLSDYARIREITTIPIALNESVTDSLSVARIVKENAADYIIPDFPDAGGLQEVISIGNIALSFGIECAFHCWHDMGIKTAAIAHVLSSQPAYTLGCDTTYFGLEHDIITHPFEIINGSIQPSDQPGLGIEPDMDMIEKYRKKVID